MLFGNADSSTVVKVVSAVFLTIEFVILFRLATHKIAHWLERRDIRKRLAEPAPIPEPEPEPVPIPKGCGRRYPEPMPANDVADLVARKREFIPEAWAAEALILLEESQVKMACLYDPNMDTITYAGTKLDARDVATCRNAADLQALIERTCK